MTTSAASMLLEFSSLSVAASGAAVNKSGGVPQSSGVSSRVSWSGLRAGGLQVGGVKTWRDVKKVVGAKARVCAVAELFESEVLGSEGDGAEAAEAPVKAVKPKTGKAALPLKSDRVSLTFSPRLSSMVSRNVYLQLCLNFW